PRLPSRSGGPEAVPLSFSQQRMWFLQQLDPGSSAYNLSRPIRLRGALRIAALAAALDALVRRHESLRTGFVVVDGTPLQRVAPEAEVPLPLVDLSALDATAAARESSRLAALEA